MNLTVITQTTAPTGEERFDCTITIPFDGFTETIEGLYDIASCLAWADMMLSIHNAKYVACC